MRDFDSLLTAWCALSEDASVVIVTDVHQYETALAVQVEMSRSCCIRLYDASDSLKACLATLRPCDLVVVLWSYHTAVDMTRPRWFGPFGKPDWLAAKCAFIRLSIAAESLREGLSTRKADVYAKVAERAVLPVGALLRVTNAAGTDLTLRAGPFTTCAHEITADGGHCFLPPSETSSDTVTRSANGRIVVDVTVGQVHRFAEELGHFGLVDAPVMVVVENGVMADVYGSPMAEAFKACIFALPEDARTLVELGQGLSDMKPTGLIGVDESIRASCHFGFGHHANGTHTDLVISQPTIEVVG